MTSSLFLGSSSQARSMRTSILGTSAQRNALAQPETAVVMRPRLAVRQPLLCQANRRGYRDFRNSSDWADLFQGLADMSKAFDYGRGDYTAGGRPFRRSSPQGGDPIDADSEEPERPIVVPVDVEEYADGYSLFMDVPGLQKSDVKIQLLPQQRTITISGERRRTEPEAGLNEEGRSFRRRYERRMGKFSRTLRLAKDLDIESIKARVEKGVLCVSAKKIPVVDPASDTMEISVE